MIVICKLCNANIEYDDILIHAAMIHNDKDAARIQTKLDLMNAVLDDDEEPIKISDLLAQ